MSEPVVFEGSPLAQYLGGLDHPELAVAEREPTRQWSARDVERLKYALATSHLLSPTIFDALELYPPHSPTTPARAQVVPWPPRWDSIGTSWRDRTVLNTTCAVLLRLVDAVKRTTLAVEPAAVPATTTTRRPSMSLKVDAFVNAAQQLDRVIEAALDHLESNEPSTDMVRSLSSPPATPPHSRHGSTSFSRRRGPSPPSPLPTHASAHAHESLSTELAHLVDLYRRATSRVSSLLVPSSSSPSQTVPVVLPPSQQLTSVEVPAPHSPARAIKTRSRTIHHHPTASLSELHRHASRAIEERHEVERFETAAVGQGSVVSSDDDDGDDDEEKAERRRRRRAQEQSNEKDQDPLLASSSPQTQTQSQLQSPVVDPFHPTATFFGGLDRKSSTRSIASTSASTSGGGGVALKTHGRTSSSLSLSGETLGTTTTTTRHRLRPSVGTVGAFGVGTAAAAASANANANGNAVSPLLREVSRRTRTRPKSMGGWVDSPGTLSSPSPLWPLPSSSSSSSPFVGTPMSPTLPRGGGGGRRSEALTRVWEAAHSFRKGFLWNLIAVFEESTSDVTIDDDDDDEEEGQDSKWSATRRVVGELTNDLDRLSDRIQLVTRRTTIRGPTTSVQPMRASATATTSPCSSPSPFRQPPSVEGHDDHATAALRRRTGASEAPGSPFLASSTSSAPPAFRRPDRHPPQPDFAPPTDVAPRAKRLGQALAEYESLHGSLSDTIETLQHSLDDVLSRVRIVAPTMIVADHVDEKEEEEEEQLNASSLRAQRITDLLERHDHVKDLLHRLATDWTTSRIALRTAVGQDQGQPPQQQQQQQRSSLSNGRGVTVGRRGVVVVEDELNANDAPPELAPGDDERGSIDAALDDGGTEQRGPRDDDESNSRQAVVDATEEWSLSFRTSLDDDQTEEKVFEAVAGVDHLGSLSSSSSGPPTKLTRDERVKRMREAREALDAGKKATAAARALRARGEAHEPLLDDDDDDGGRAVAGLEAQQRMVGELRQVLKGLGKGV